MVPKIIEEIEKIVEEKKLELIIVKTKKNMKAWREAHKKLSFLDRVRGWIRWKH